MMKVNIRVRKRPLWMLMVIVVLLPGSCATVPHPRLASSISEALGGDWGARYFGASVDLNDDGANEVIVLVAGPQVCGTGGCPVLVFSPPADGYRILANIAVAQPPIRVSNDRSHGWRSLIVGVGGGGAKAGNVALDFDGEHYPSNATVAPARYVDSVSESVIVIPGFESYLDGKPVRPD